MTGSIRLFTTEALSEGATIQISPEQAHYLGSVMRRGPGDDVVLFNGTHGEFLASIATIKRDKAQLAVGAQLRPQAAEPELTLVFAPLKRDTTNLVVEKATELGVTRIQPVFTERTNAGRLNLDRFAAIAREASEQCERLCVPEILPPMKFFDLLGSWPHDRVLSAAIERGHAGYPSRRGFPQALLIGPEGGFSPVELDAMRRLAFVESIGLGPRILRAETAAIAGLALLQAAASG